MAPNPKKKQTSENPEIIELQQKVGELTDALQRERADAINVRRRAEEDRVKMASYFKSMVVKELLPFIDNFDRAIIHMPKVEDKVTQDWLHGLEGIKKQLIHTLESLGVKKIKTVGEVFDPRYHEAVQMDASGSGSSEVVTEEFSPGYIMDNEVLRHAMVRVATR